MPIINALKMEFLCASSAYYVGRLHRNQVFTTSVPGIGEKGSNPGPTIIMPLVQKFSKNVSISFVAYIHTKTFLPNLLLYV